MTCGETTYQPEIISEIDDYRVRTLPDNWNDQILEVIRKTPVKTGNLTIHFDRSPDIFTIPKCTSYRYKALGFFRGNELIGVATAAYQKLTEYGELIDAIYLGNMHVTEKGTGRIFLKKLTLRISKMACKLPEVKYLYAYVMGANQRAMKLVQLGELDSKVAGSISMHTIFTLKPMAQSRKFLIRKASNSDIDKIVELISNELQNNFLAPEFSKDIFIRNLVIRPGVNIEDYYLAMYRNRIIGVCLAWDMTSIKKNRVEFHGWRMNSLRCLYNFFAGLLGSPRLPKSGKPFRDVTVTEQAVTGRDPEVMEALLRRIYCDYRKLGFQSVIFGCCSNDVMMNAVNPFISKEVRSHVVIAPLHNDSKTEISQIPPVYADAIQI